MAQVQLKKCNTCNEKGGSFYCYECRKFLCDTCRKFHDKFTKGHCVKDSKHVDRTVLEVEVTCKTHSQEYSYYCERCLYLICDKCALENHKYHQFSRVDEMAKKTRENLQKYTTKVEKKMIDVVDTITKLEAFREDDLPNHEISLKKAVEGASKKIIDIIKGVTLQNLENIKTQCRVESNCVVSNLNELRRKKGCFQQVIRENVHKLNIEHDITFLAIYPQDTLMEEENDFKGAESRSFIKEYFDEAKFWKQCIEKIEANCKTENRVSVQEKKECKESSCLTLKKENQQLVEEIDRLSREKQYTEIKNQGLSEQLAQMDLANERLKNDCQRIKEELTQKEIEINDKQLKSEDYKSLTEKPSKGLVDSIFLKKKSLQRSKTADLLSNAKPRDAEVSTGSEVTSAFRHRQPFIGSAKCFNIPTRRELKKSGSTFKNDPVEIGYGSRSKCPEETVNIQRSDMFKHRDKTYALNDNKVYVWENNSWVPTNNFI